MIKWICAGIGFYFGGLLGAVAGYFIGSFVQGMISGAGDDNYFTDGNRQSYYNGRTTYSGQNSYSGSQYNSRAMFLNCLLEMSAYIIVADGRIMHSEMEMVRAFLRTNFDERTVQACNDRLLAIFESRKQMPEQQWRQQVMASCGRVGRLFPQEQCMQLLAFLAEIAKADGKVDSSEIGAMREVAVALGLPSSLVDQMLSLGGGSVEDAYKVLGISPDATDDEVRRAYRKMALQYHPDRVATLGKDVQEAAKKRFQEINEAKDRIFKERGL